MRVWYQLLELVDILVLCPPSFFFFLLQYEYVVFIERQLHFVTAKSKKVRTFLH